MSNVVSMETALDQNAVDVTISCQGRWVGTLIIIEHLKSHKNEWKLSWLAVLWSLEQQCPFRKQWTENQNSKTCFFVFSVCQTRFAQSFRMPTASHRWRRSATQPRLLQTVNWSSVSSSTTLGCSALTSPWPMTWAWLWRAPESAWQ